MTPSGHTRLTKPTNSNDPPLAPPQHALAPPTALQVLFEPALRVHRALPAEEIGARGARGGVLLCEFCVCAGVGRGGGESLEGEFDFLFLPCSYLSFYSLGWC